MKVITIKQPFASLIANGYKHYEFRTWKTKYRGILLIHAGIGTNKEALNKYQSLNLDYKKGCIIAKCIITDCIEVDNEFRKQLKKENYLVYKRIIEDKNWEGYAFKLENIKKIEPIYLKGKLSLWDYEGEINEFKS